MFEYLTNISRDAISESQFGDPNVFLQPRNGDLSAIGNTPRSEIEG